jgi:hypothetical protein
MGNTGVAHKIIWAKVDSTRQRDFEAGQLTAQPDREPSAERILH